MRFYKKLYLSIAALAAAISAYAIVPEVDYTPYFITIDDVQRTPDGLRMDVTLNHLPHYWVSIDSASVLVDQVSGREYRLVGQENIPFNTEIWMPDSGHHSGVLFFEAVPDDVKVVDFYEPGSKPRNRAFGIHLDEQRVATEPKGLTKGDILNPDSGSWKLPVLEWSGLNPENYRRMDFVKPDSTTIVRGHIDHHLPKLGMNTVTVTTRNLITDKDNQTVGEVDSTGCFTMTVPVDYPQMALLQYGDMARSVFLCPNDTFEVYTTTLMHMETEPYHRLAPEYIGFNSVNPDAVAVTLLHEDAEVKLGTDEFGWQSVRKATDEGLDSVMALNAKIKAKMNRLISEAPAVINQYPVSPFAKDILYTCALLDAYDGMMDLPMYWKDNAMIRDGEDESGRPVMRPNPDYKPIDVKEFHGGVEAYASLLYDNPLVMCTGWIFFNRCEYGELFGSLNNISSGSLFLRVDNNAKYEVDPATYFENGESRYERVRAMEKDRQESVGIGDCFIQQLIIAKNLSNKLSTLAVLNEEGMEFDAELVSEMLPLLSYRPLVRQVVDDWADINREIGRLEGNSIVDNSRSVDTGSDVLAAVIEPYRGNVIYVDVWDMGCGPCRSGMLNQRELIKQTADKPLTVIYLNTEDEKDQAERWMRNNDIHGEHVYLSADNRARLSADFNITGIPYGILIDKKGNIRETNMHGLSLDDYLLQQLLNE